MSWRDSTITALVSVCHRGSYAETYSRYSYAKAYAKLAAQGFQLHWQSAPVENITQRAWEQSRNIIRSPKVRDLLVPLDTPFALRHTASN
jgi:hypothetical protein